METIEEFNENFDVKKPKKKGLLITVIAIIAVVIALIATYFLIFTKPQFIFSKAIDKMFVKTDKIDSMKMDYKLKASVETDDISIQQYTEELEKCTLNFGFQLDAESKQEVVALGLDYKDEQVIDLKTYYNNEGIYLYLDEIFEKYIKVDTDENQIESIKEAFEQFSDENIKKSNKIMQIIRDELKEQINEEGTFEKAKETIKIGDKDKKVTKYTLDLSQESLINILSNMLLDLSEDEEFLEAMGDDSFKSELDKASKALIENSKKLDKNMLNVKINIYTKGILNNFAGMDIEINTSMNNQKAAIVFNVLKESKEIYEYSIKMKSQGINAKVLSGKIENQIEKDTKKEGKGKVIITAKVPEYIYSLKANIEVDYSIEVNNGIDKIDVSNSVNMKDLTEKDRESVRKKLMTKPLIGDFLTSMDDGLFEQAEEATDEEDELLSKAKKSTFQTNAMLIKELVSIEQVKMMTDNGGIVLEDYSVIKVENLTELKASVKEEFKDKIIVNKNGDICYNPENVTLEEKGWLEEIGIKAISS